MIIFVYRLKAVVTPTDRPVRVSRTAIFRPTTTTTSATHTSTTRPWVIRITLYCRHTTRIRCQPFHSPTASSTCHSQHHRHLCLRRYLTSTSPLRVTPVQSSIKPTAFDRMPFCLHLSSVNW